MSLPRYIAIEGPIGAGKTSLSAKLAEDLQARLVLEKLDDNPFLAEFYQDRRKHALKTQILFLISRYQQQRELIQHDLFSQMIICDYLFAKDRIFASLNLSKDEQFIYEKIYSLLDAQLPKPDLVVYLQASLDVLKKHIKKRGLDYEKHIDMGYVEELSEAYNRFFFTYTATPVLTVNVTDIDFVKNPNDYANLVREILNTSKRGRGMTRFVGIGK
ncbi:MAG: deoxynucleoside kinase [Deltaproteobacteria bacterium]|nr:MAG: deoxynucleoside kinase [Deltaproteobacteria bacterium]